MPSSEHIQCFYRQSSDGLWEVFVFNPDEEMYYSIGKYEYQGTAKLIMESHSYSAQQSGK